MSFVIKQHIFSKTRQGTVMKVMSIDDCFVPDRYEHFPEIREFKSALEARDYLRDNRESIRIGYSPILMWIEGKYGGVYSWKTGKLIRRSIDKLA